MTGDGGGEEGGGKSKEKEHERRGVEGKMTQKQNEAQIMSLMPRSRLSSCVSRQVRRKERV